MNECPHQDIIALYHKLLPAHPRVKAWNKARAGNLRARWREDAKRQNLAYWERFFEHVSGSMFLTGRRYSEGKSPFLASLAWLVQPEKFANVIEGQYHDAGAA